MILLLDSEGPNHTARMSIRPKTRFRTVRLMILNEPSGYKYSDIAHLKQIDEG